VTDTKQAEEAIGATPSLEFRLASSTEVLAFEKSVAASGATTSLETNPAFTALFKSTGLNGATISRASLRFDSTTNQPQVGLAFTPTGVDLFDQITKNNIHSYLGIFLDGVLIEFPTINTEIPNGQAVITGGFTRKAPARSSVTSTMVLCRSRSRSSPSRPSARPWPGSC